MKKLALALFCVVAFGGGCLTFGSTSQEDDVNLVAPADITSSDTEEDSQKVEEKGLGVPDESEVKKVAQEDISVKTYYQQWLRQFGKNTTPQVSVLDEKNYYMLLGNKEEQGDAVELALFLSPDGKHKFFVSQRSCGIGCIGKFEIYEMGSGSTLTNVTAQAAPDGVNAQSPRVLEMLKKDAVDGGFESPEVTTDVLLYNLPRFGTVITVDAYGNVSNADPGLVVAKGVYHIGWSKGEFILK